MSAASDIAWIQQEVLDQVDAAIEQFTVYDPHKLLDLSKVIVSSIIDKIDVAHVLGMYYHIAATQDTVSSPEDRLQCVYDHFNEWVELELAKRYA
jgi:hypothetical protein